jgi:putative sterol carrier protein
MSVQPIFIVHLPGRRPEILLRALDAHGEIYCPPELQLANLLYEYTRVIEKLCEGHPPSLKPALLNQRLRREVTRSVERMMKMASPGRNLWCEQSASTLEHLSLVQLYYPEARFICVHRHCLDFVGAAMEAMRYEFSDAAYEREILRNSKVNGFQTLAAYWCEQTQRMADFEKQNPKQCFRIRYESLIFESEKAISNLFSFLQLTHDAGVLRRVLSPLRKAGVAGQIKEPEEKFSVGRGQSLPLRGIALATLEQLNGLLREMGYDEVRSDWNAKTEPHLRYGSADRLAGRYAREKLKELFEYWIPSLFSRGAAAKDFVGKKLEISIKDVKGARWLVDFDNSTCVKMKAEEKADCAMALGFETMVKLSNNEVNLAAAVAEGKIHCLGDRVFFESLRKAFA